MSEARIDGSFLNRKLLFGNSFRSKQTSYVKYRLHERYVFSSSILRERSNGLQLGKLRVTTRRVYFKIVKAVAVSEVEPQSLKGILSISNGRVIVLW